MTDMRTKLSALWIFAMLNYLYCDLLGVHDPAYLRLLLTGNINGLEISQGFLLGASVLMEIPIAMTLASRLVSRHAVNRWANIVAGAVMTIVQLASLFVGTPTAYYLFFSVVEVACTSAIVWYAWRWHRAKGDHATAPDAVIPAEAGTGRGSRG
jgi:Family of unknown function (DUF6326)